MVFSLCFHGQEKHKIRAFAHYTLRTTILITIRFLKTSLFSFRVHCFGFEIYLFRAKQAKHLQSILDENEYHPCFQYLIQIFVTNSCDRPSDLAECSAVTRPLSQRDRWASWVTDALFQGIAGLTAELSVFPFLNFTFADFERQDYFLIPV